MNKTVIGILILVAIVVIIVVVMSNKPQPTSAGYVPTSGGSNVWSTTGDWGGIIDSLGGIFAKKPVDNRTEYEKDLERLENLQS